MPTMLYILLTHVTALTPICDSRNIRIVKHHDRAAVGVRRGTRYQSVAQLPEKCPASNRCKAFLLGHFPVDSVIVVGDVLTVQTR